MAYGDPPGYDDGVPIHSTPIQTTTAPNQQQVSQPSYVTPTPSPSVMQSSSNTGTSAQVVPDTADRPNEINVVDAGGQLAVDPNTLFDSTMTLSDNLPSFSATQTQGGIQSSDPAQGNAGALSQTAQQANAAQATMPDTSQTSQAAEVQTATTIGDVTANAMEGQNGTVSQNAQVDTNGLEIDTDAAMSNAAYNNYAKQNISTIIDTTTTSGKALAELLGDGNYTDSKATVKGQMDILTNEFVDPNTGLPRIPSWASGIARNVSRIAAFKGMTGTAATAAISQALLEASLPMATADAQFFQTLTLKNLDNKQQSIINKANVLSKLDLANLDARTTAAVQNAQAFLAMDMKNLDNDQQAELINTQERFQSILEDAKTENANRMFMAESQNEKDKFYDQLSSAMSQFNADQRNTMAQFNTGEANDMSQFNANMEDSREKFYREMQFNIDTANAKWRQTIAVTENAQAFEAAATDVKNRVGVSVEQLNRLWDRADALLDYSWKAAQNDKDRKTQLALVSLKGEIDSEAANQAGWGNAIGTVLGGLVGWLF